MSTFQNLEIQMQQKYNVLQWKIGITN